MDVITFQCRSCQHTLRIGADKAGRKARCTKCGTELVIPAAPAKPVPVPAKPAVDEEEESVGVYAFKDEPAKPPPSEPPRQARRKKIEDEDEDQEDDELEADEPRRPAGPSLPKSDEAAGKKIKRKIVRQRKLLEPDRWRKVEIGFRIVAIGCCIWLGAFILRLLPPILGFIAIYLGEHPPEYASLAQRYAAGLETPPGSNALGRAEFLMGLVAGSDSLDTGLLLARISQILMVIQGLVFLGGYAFCLAVPPRFGSRGLAIGLLSLGSLNFILQLVFKLLPLMGAMNFAPIFLVAPEIVLHPANVDRFVPLNVVWSDAPFAELLLSIFVISLFYFEPVVFCMFLRAVTMAMKDELLEGKARALMTIGLAQVFAQLAYQMLSITGSSDVLQWVLRAVYMIGAGFFIGQMVWYAKFFFGMPGRIEKELSEDGQPPRPSFRDETDEEDEDDEEDDDEEEEDEDDDD